MPLHPEAILFQHFPFLMRPSSNLSSLLNTSVTTNTILSRPVQTEVVRKFTGSTAIGMWPLATAVTGYLILGHSSYWLSDTWPQQLLAI